MRKISFYRFGFFLCILFCRVPLAQALLPAGCNFADINWDQKVDAVDLQLAINARLGFPIDGNADVNCDGVVDAVDVQYVKNCALSISVQPSTQCTSRPIISNVQFYWSQSYNDQHPSLATQIARDNIPQGMQTYRPLLGVFWPSTESIRNVYQYANKTACLQDQSLQARQSPTDNSAAFTPAVSDGSFSGGYVISAIAAAPTVQNFAAHVLAQGVNRTGFYEWVRIEDSNGVKSNCAEKWISVVPPTVVSADDPHPNHNGYFALDGSNVPMSGTTFSFYPFFVSPVPNDPNPLQPVPTQAGWESLPISFWISGFGSGSVHPSGLTKWRFYENANCSSSPFLVGENTDSGGRPTVDTNGNVDLYEHPGITGLSLFAYVKNYLGPNSTGANRVDVSAQFMVNGKWTDCREYSGSLYAHDLGANPPRILDCGHSDRPCQ